MADLQQINAAYHSLIEALENESCMVFSSFESSEWFESNLKTLADVNREKILSSKHLFLPKSTHAEAFKIVRKQKKLADDCPYGDTFLGDQQFAAMASEIKKCTASLKKKEIKKSYEILLGVLISLEIDDHWVRDNESWMEKSFPKFFDDFSLCWQIVLGNSNEDLNLTCKFVAGVQSYREMLLVVIKCVQDSVNSALSDTNDCDVKKVCVVSILPLPEVLPTIYDLPGRKPSPEILGADPVEPHVLLPKSKKPRKPTGRGVWLLPGQSRKVLMNRMMKQWEKDVKEWEEENREFLESKKKGKKKQPANNANKENKSTQQRILASKSENQPKKGKTTSSANTGANDDAAGPSMIY